MPAFVQLPLVLPRGDSSALTWRQADHDVFVADHAGAYAGHVTVDAAGYTVYDRIGVCRGVCASLEGAQAQLGEFSESDDALLLPTSRRTRRGIIGRIRGRRNERGLSWHSAQ